MVLGCWAGYSYSLKMSKSLEEIYPGEILLHEFMMPMGVSDMDLAEKAQISVELVREIIKGNSRITPEIATCLKDVFSIEANFWINLQTDYDSRIGQLVN